MFGTKPEPDPTPLKNTDPTLFFLGIRIRNPIMRTKRRGSVGRDRVTQIDNFTLNELETRDITAAPK